MLLLLLLSGLVVVVVNVVDAGAGHVCKAWHMYRQPQQHAQMPRSYTHDKHMHPPHMRQLQVWLHLVEDHFRKVPFPRQTVCCTLACLNGDSRPACTPTWLLGDCCHGALCDGVTHGWHYHGDG